MDRSIMVHKLLTLQGPLNDMIFLEHYYFISTLKSYLLTKNGQNLIFEFMNTYSIEEQLLVIHYFLEKESAFCIYFKTPLKVLEKYLNLLEKNTNKKETKKEISLLQYTLKRYPLLFQEELNNKELYETIEMESRGLLLENPEKVLKDCFLIDALVNKVLVHKQPLSTLNKFLNSDVISYVLGSVHKLLYDMEEYPFSISYYAYKLKDYTYLQNIIEEISSYAKDDISKSLVELIELFLENSQEQDFYEEKGKILEFRR